MSTSTKELADVLKSLATSSSLDCFLGFDSNSGEFLKPSPRAVENYVFGSVFNQEDLDNPISRGVFNVTPTTPITRPSKGTGWNYGYVINLAVSTGVQVWFNFEGYIAVRGKGSSGGQWSDWSVMARM